MKIGIAGTGKMGTAVATRLKSVGHDVLVWNRTEAKAQAAVALGATWCATAKDLIQQSDIVICLLTNEQALDDVYFSSNGLLSAPANGKLIIEMSTVSPDKQSVMAQKASTVGVKYLECPVGGSIGPTGEILAPIGPLSIGDAQAAFADSFNQMVKALRNYKAQTVKGGLGTGGRLGVSGGETAASKELDAKSGTAKPASKSTTTKSTTKK